MYQKRPKKEKRNDVIYITQDSKSFSRSILNCPANLQEK